MAQARSAWGYSPCKNQTPQAEACDTYPRVTDSGPIETLWFSGSEIMTCILEATYVASLI